MTREMTHLSGLQPLTDRDFARFRELVEREAGIHLSEAKRALLVGRLSRRLKALGIASFGAYLRRVTEEGDLEERVRMIDALCTHETHFFRGPAQFELLEREVLPAWRAAGREGKRVRAWSAACSSGEEPFSVAMMLLDHFPPEDGWAVEVVATDLSTAVLERARAATWPIAKSEEIPTRYLKAFMLQGTRASEGLMRAGDRLRACVEFRHLNLRAGAYPPLGRFDLVFCRNVLIYFGPAMKAHVLGQMRAHLAPGGVLLLGNAETLSGMNSDLSSLMPAVYADRSTAPARTGSGPARRSAR